MFVHIYACTGNLVLEKQILVKLKYLKYYPISLLSNIERISERFMLNRLALGKKIQPWMLLLTLLSY